jgi:hypothetical protein
MKKYGSIILFLLFSLPVFTQEIPNGIYLLANEESRSFYPRCDSVFVTDAHDHKISLLVMPGPFFGEKDMYRAEYVLAHWYNGKQDAWCFEFSLVERGNVKLGELIERDAAPLFVFVFNEKAIASGKLLQKGGVFLHLAATCNYGEIKIPFTIWSDRLHANFDKQWNPLTRDSAYYYTNGRLAEDRFFKNGDRTEDREWFYNGRVKKTAYDSADFHCSITYDAKGNLQTYDRRNGFGRRDDHYAKWYFPNGILRHVDSCYTIGKKTHELDYWYDTTGALTEKNRTEYLDYLSGEEGEFNNPMVVRTQQYENGKLVKEFEMYTSCGECEWEYTGMQKYYENGKLVKTEQNPDWKTLYRKVGGTLK